MRFVVVARAPDELTVADDELGAVGQTIGSENEDILSTTLPTNLSLYKIITLTRAGYLMGYSDGVIIEL